MTLCGSLILDMWVPIFLSNRDLLFLNASVSPALPACLPTEVCIVGNDRNKIITRILLPRVPHALNINQLPFLLVPTPQCLTNLHALPGYLTFSFPTRRTFPSAKIHTLFLYQELPRNCIFYSQMLLLVFMS